MKPISKTEMLAEIKDENNGRPFGEFQYYLKSIDSDNTAIFRFNNGYGAFVDLYKNEVTAIAWREDAKNVRDYYDVIDTMSVDNIFGYLDIIQTWAHKPPPF